MAEFTLNEALYALRTVHAQGEVVEVGSARVAVADELELAFRGIDLGQELANALRFAGADRVIIKVEVDLELEGLAADRNLRYHGIRCNRLNHGQRGGCRTLRRRHDHHVVRAVELHRNLTAKRGVGGQGSSALLGVFGVGELAGVNDLSNPGVKSINIKDWARKMKNRHLMLASLYS